MKTLILTVSIFINVVLLVILNLPDETRVDLFRYRQVGGVIETVLKTGALEKLVTISPNGGLVAAHLDDGKYIISNYDQFCGERRLYEREKITVENGKITWHEISTGSCQ